MATFDDQLLCRLPLAESVLTVLKHVWDEDGLAELFARHRGTGCEVKVTFSLLVELVMDAIIEYRGSGRQSFRQAREDGRLRATDGAVYGKLRRMPVRLSEAFLRETTRRISDLLPVDNGVSNFPASLRNHRVLVVDGKKLKKLPKRLKPLREVSGKVLGGKVVVGMMLNQGLAVAMHASPDGEANDAPLTPGLLDQIDQSDGCPVVVVADRQFCGLRIPLQIIERGHDFLIRYSRRMRFFPENQRQFGDLPDRQISEAWGMLGCERESQRLWVRQVTLSRPHEDDVILITNLLDADAFPAEEILQLYLERWKIERLFQQVTTVFHVQQLIGTSPQGAIFQFALCSCLYNVIQLIRRYLAAANNQVAANLSGEMIFQDVSRQITAITQFISLGDVATMVPSFTDRQQVLERITQLITRQKWSELWIKCRSTRRKPGKTKIKVPGGHCSAYKLIQQAKKPP